MIRVGVSNFDRGVNKEDLPLSGNMEELLR